MNSEGRTIHILLVEDNPGDVRLTKEALREGKISNHLDVVMDGAAALDFLLRRGDYENAKRPDLVLLDLNLPKIDGRQVLAEIKRHESLRRTPVIILTTSEAEQDIIETYNLYANCYITKPVDLDNFIRVVCSIEDFWLKVVRLPKPDED